MIHLYYNNKKIEKEGQFLTPEETSSSPVITFSPVITLKNPYNQPNSNYYSVILYDPNSVRAPNFVHWALINVPLNKNNMIFISELDNEERVNNGTTLIEYQGPSPPENSGIHNYTVLIYKQDKLYGPEFISSVDTNNRNYNYLLTKLNLNSNNKLISKTFFTSKHTEKGGKKNINKPQFLLRKEKINFKQRKSNKKQMKSKKSKLKNVTIKNKNKK